MDASCTKPRKLAFVDAQVAPLGKCVKQGSKRSKEPLELRQLCPGKKLRVVVHLLA